MMSLEAVGRAREQTDIIVVIRAIVQNNRRLTINNIQHNLNRNVSHLKHSKKSVK